MISLAHVKSSSSEGTNVQRIAWPGGKLTSNKEEALKKFMERKKLLEEEDSTTPSNKSSQFVATEGPSLNPSKKHAKNDKKIYKKHHAVQKRPNIVKKRGHDKRSQKELRTTDKLSMSLDDIVKKKK